MDNNEEKTPEEKELFEIMEKVSSDEEAQAPTPEPEKEAAPVEEKEPEPEQKQVEEAAPEQQAEEKTETRGRHKKECTCEKCEATRARKTKKAETPFNESEYTEQKAHKDLFGEVKQPQTQQPQTQQPKHDASQFVTGFMLMAVIDAVFPSAIKAGLSFYKPEFKRLKEDALRLTDKEKKEMEPLAHEMVKILLSDVSPVTFFVIALGALYGSKVVTLDKSDFKSE